MTLNYKTFVFPAPAGINRQRPGYIALSPGVPRASGDKPSGELVTWLNKLCSPRQRG
ncbi:hypothetical protein IO934_000035 [Escherichia coli]|nr:hypothetical protein [Escherichia coli]